MKTENMTGAISLAKNTVYFIGRMHNRKIQAHATAFLISVKGFFHLVTAKHVVMDEYGHSLDRNILFIYNGKKSFYFRDIDDLKREKVDWVFHENKDVDIAIMPIKVNPLTDDVNPIPHNTFVTIEELSEAQDIFYVSYQPGIEIEKRIRPIVRRGMISLINNNKTFYMDGFAFPGNSGSPVFTKLNSDSMSQSLNLSAKLAPKLIGIIGAYLPYSERAISEQTGRTRITFEDNTGLSVVWSTNHLNEIINSKKFQTQLEYLTTLEKRDSKNKKAGKKKRKTKSSK